MVPPYIRYKSKGGPCSYTLYLEQGGPAPMGLPNATVTGLTGPIIVYGLDVEPNKLNIYCDTCTG